MKRRELMLLLGGAAISWPFAGRAQQPAKISRVGILSDETLLRAAKSFEPFEQGLRDLGYVEGQNIAFEHRYAELKNEIMPDLAAELVRLKPDIILAIGTPATRVVKTTTQTIPIVFVRIADPVGLGFVAGLARPGGNLTGVSLQTRELAAKRVELLLMAAPDVKRVGVLWDPRLPSSRPEVREIEGAAQSLNVELAPAEVRSPDDVEPALRAIVEQRAGALIVVPGSIFTERSLQLADLTAKARLPAMLWRREHAEAGIARSRAR